MFYFNLKLQKSIFKSFIYGHCFLHNQNIVKTENVFWYKRGSYKEDKWLKVLLLLCELAKVKRIWFFEHNIVVFDFRIHSICLFLYSIIHHKSRDLYSSGSRNSLCVQVKHQVVLFLQVTGTTHAPSFKTLLTKAKKYSTCYEVYHYLSLTIFQIIPLKKNLFELDIYVALYFHRYPI